MDYARHLYVFQKTKQCKSQGLVKSKAGFTPLNSQIHLWLWRKLLSQSSQHNRCATPPRSCIPLWEDICQGCNCILQSITLTLYGSHSSVMVEDVWMDLMWWEIGKGRRDKEGKEEEENCKRMTRKSKNRVMRLKSNDTKQRLAWLIPLTIHIPAWHTHKALL